MSVWGVRWSGAGRRLVIAAVAAATAIALVACGSEKSGESAPTSTSAEPTETTATQAGAVDVDPRFEMTVSYEDASSSDARAGQQLMESNQLLEILANNVNKYLLLPEDVPLVGAECGTANAFWDPDEQSITMCYEILDLFVQLFEQDRDPDPEGAALATTAAVFFHELGHAVTSIYQLPTLGREEDAADQLSAVLLLTEQDPELQTYALYYAKAFELLSGMEDLSPGSFADEHSLNAQRNYNILCWAYGSDPAELGAEVEAAGLPAERAARCEDEYQQIEGSWYQLLRPYLKPQ